MARIVNYNYNHEHRAPTDDSIKLLREMEKKAREEVDKSVSLSVNDFKCTIHSMLDHFNNAINFRVYYDINGRKQIVNVTVPGYEKNTVDIGKKVLDAVAQHFAENVIHELADNLNKMYPKYMSKE
jgi:hypothetical protein